MKRLLLVVSLFAFQLPAFATCNPADIKNCTDSVPQPVIDPGGHSKKLTEQICCQEIKTDPKKFEKKYDQKPGPVQSQ